MGQLNHLLIRPYRRTPLSLGQVVDESQPYLVKQSVANDFVNKRMCCVDQYLSKPLKSRIKSVNDILPGGKSVTKLCMALRNKNINVEIENNLARATNMRAAQRGRTHNCASMVAKHVTAEMVLGRVRDEQRRTSEAPLSPSDAGRLCLFWFV